MPSKPRKKSKQPPAPAAAQIEDRMRRSREDSQRQHLERPAIISQTGGVPALLRQQALAVRGIPSLGTDAADAGCLAGQYIARAIELGAFAGGPRDAWLAPIRERLSYAKQAKGSDPHLSAFAETVFLAWREAGEGTIADSRDITSPRAFQMVAGAIDSEAERLETSSIRIHPPIQSHFRQSSNPLLAETVIHPNLKPLFDTLISVLGCSAMLTDCYPQLLSLMASRGKPRPEDWPDSPAFERDRARNTQWAEATREECSKRGEAAYVGDFVESEWTEAMREWSDWYKKWCIAITDAKQAVNAPGVAAVMNEGEARPAHRWTTQAMIELNNLAGTLSPWYTGGDDGLGFIRCGLPPFPATFHTCAAAIDRRIAELRAIPIASIAIGASTVPPVTSLQVPARSTGPKHQTLDGDLKDNDRFVVKALREIGHRVSGEVLMNKALGKANPHGKAILASLVSRKVITNKRDVKPPGYGLPEWP